MGGDCEVILPLPIVAEVQSDGLVVIYESYEFDCDDAAELLDHIGGTEDRHFFLATLTLTPLQEI
jgi:hypothetical protein